MPNFEFSDEERQLVDTAREFARKEIVPVAGELDEHGTFPADICKKAWETGLMNCEIPEAVGGLGLTCLAHCLVLEEISYGCTGVNTTLAANMLGTMPIIIAGTDAQKREYLGRLLAAPVFAAYCCSEPDAGSDVAGMKTRYKKVGDDYVITGQKRWITNGGVASFYTVFAREEGTSRHKGVTCFVVDRQTPGLSVGKKENKMGQRCSNTTDVIFEEVKVGKANIVGPEGDGFKVAMRTFDRTRPWIAAGAAGIIRRALEESRKYALERKTFGVPIAQHQAIQFMLADMAIAYEATRLLCHKAAAGIDGGKPDSIVSSYAKAYGADAAMRVATDAVQIFGGYGYTKEYPVEKLMRDAKLLQIYEGTSQIQRMVIARNVLGRLVKLSLVIPVYNEMPTLREIVSRIAAVDLDKELVLVDDMSTDGSREALTELREQGLERWLSAHDKQRPRLRTNEVQVLLQPENMGKGAALRAGFAAATGDIVVVQDADLEYDPQDLPRVIQPIVDGIADVTFGSRFIGTPRRALFFWHQMLNNALTLMSNMFNDLNITDMETCYKAFRSEVIKAITVEEDRFGIEPELTAKVARMRLRIYEVPVSYHGRTYDEGKKIGWTDGVRAIYCIVKYGIRRRPR